MIWTRSRFVRAAQALLCGVGLALLPTAIAAADEPSLLFAGQAVEGRPQVVEEGRPVTTTEAIYGPVEYAGYEGPRFSKFALKRVPISVFELDSATPANILRLRVDGAWEWERPDRAEYFWARIGGRGPALPENEVDVLDLRLYYEAGAGPISFITDLGIRSIDPDVNGDTTGFSDMNIAIKSRLFEGEKWELSSIFRTYLPTGSPSHGTGTGHVSMEPGILFRYALRCTTSLHSEIKYFFPLGADPAHSGQVLRWGLGASHLAWEHSCKKIALIPTAELVGFHFLDGLQTSPAGVLENVDNVFVLNLMVGSRLLLGEKTDLGLSGGWAISDDTLYQGLIRFDLRFLF